MEPIVVDLFCGAGGLTNGLESAGLNVAVGYDVDESCRFPYETNNSGKFICKDIRSIQSDEIYDVFRTSDISVLVGCAPCQPFSSHANKNKTRKTSDKWTLLNEFGRLIEEIKPTIISMENVPQLARTDVFSDFIGLLFRSHYRVSYDVINLSDIGVPQSRKRLVLLASRLGNISLKQKDCKKVVLADCISDLPKIVHGEVDSEDPLHCSQRLSPTNLKRIQHSLPGGTWRDWPDELLLECHKKSTGRTYPGVYGRLEWNKESSTITTQFFTYGTGRFGHPDQDRALSLREGALIQTFPRQYSFFDTDRGFSFSIIGKLIGNAVPPKLGEYIGESIIAHIKEHNNGQ